MEGNCKIILCRGIQGSGKSTWAKQWVNEDPEHRVRFNNDDIRNMLGPYWVPIREPLIYELRYHFLQSAMFHDYDIVIDNMNLNNKEVEFYNNVIDKHNNPKGAILDMVQSYYVLEFKDFKTPLEECIARDAKRPNPIGADVITTTYNKYKSFYEDNKV
jgi:predicted kinase